MSNFPCEAVLWIREGALFKDKLGVTNPPPLMYAASVSLPLRRRIDGSFPTPTDPLYHTLHFELLDWSPTGERAHYILKNFPPEGWAWELAENFARVVRVDEIIPKWYKKLYPTHHFEDYVQYQAELAVKQVIEIQEKRNIKEYLNELTGNFDEPQSGSL